MAGVDVFACPVRFELRHSVQVGKTQVLIVHGQGVDTRGGSVFRDRSFVGAVVVLGFCVVPCVGVYVGGSVTVCFTIFASSAA